jgi:heme/copper-type cytochrome/quinol oxidase subunit 3
MALPLYNTLLLVRSGLTLTVAHNLLLSDNRQAVQYLLFTIVLGFSFTLCQAMEYYIAPFTFSIRNYGSIFYLGTGFHGAHVLIGATLLRVRCYKIVVNAYTKLDHTFLECAI